MRAAVTAVFLEKGFLGSNYRVGRYNDYITVAFSFANNTQKVVTGIKGRVIFNDQLGDPVFESNLKITETIPAGGRHAWEGVIDYNQFMDDHERFRYAEKDDLTVVWEPETVIFADGSRIEVPPTID